MRPSSLCLDWDIDFDDKAGGGQEPSFDLGLDEQVERFEKKLILDVLEQTGWKIEKASKMLDIPRKRLYLRMQKYQISKS